MKANILIVFILGVGILSAQDTLQLSINEAVAYALENNWNKKNALLDVDKAKQKVKETIGIGLPQISGNLGYQNYLKQPVQPIEDQLFTFGTKQNALAGASLNQLIFDGSYIVGVESTKAYKKISELAVEKTDDAIIEAVLQSYSAILITEESRKILNKNLINVDKNLHDVTEIYKVGLGEEQNVEQIQYNKNVILNALTNNQNNLRILYNNLKYVLNLTLETPIVLTTTFDEILTNNLVLIDENELKDLANHIDMQIAENEVTTNKLQVKFEKSKYLPSLAGNINTSFNAYSDQFDFFNQRWYNGTYWAIGLNIPIFSGLQRKARVEQSKIELQKSENKRQNTFQDLNRNAQEKYNNYQNAVSQYNLSLQQLTLSESIYHKEEIKFYEGLGDSQNLTMAENQMYQAQSQLIQSVSQLISQKIALDKALDKFSY